MKKLIKYDLGSYTFNATGQTVTITGVPTLYQEQLLLITNTTDGIIIGNFADPNKGMTINSANTITLEYNTTSMSDSDALQIYVDIPGTDAMDYDLNALNTIVQNPTWSRYTDSESILAAAQTLTQTFADLGPEISTSGYKNIGLWLKGTVQASTGIQVKALGKHTYGGSEEYDIPIEIISADGSKVNITTEVNQVPDGSNFLYVFKVNTDNVVPYIQFQVKATSSGATAATMDTAYITKGY